jgi:tRNA 2-thiocytidine biosynthesis protein TtcA
MLREWGKKSPGRLESIFGALTNVAPSHLLDRSLFDFENIEATADSNEGLPQQVGDPRPTPIHLVPRKKSRT